MGKEQTRNPFYGQIIRLAIPVVIQNLLSAAVSSADVLMLNYVNQDAISAVSLASQYANVLFMIYYGLGTGATMLCAQYYGKKDYMAIRAVEGIALRFSLVVSAVFAALALCVPQQLMRLFTRDQTLIELGADYLRYMSVAYLCWSVIEVYLSVLRSMERVTICMVLNMVAFGLNILLNAVFIFGLFGVPKLGVSGVALATAISRVAELIGCILVSRRSKEVRLDLRYLFIRNKTLFGDFVKLSLPALGNDVVWGLGFSMYSVILGHLGSDAVAANSMAAVVRQFGTVLCYGMASAGGILLGKLIGERQPEEMIRRDASLLIRLTIACGVLGGLVVLAITPVALRYARLSGTAMGYLKTMLLINTYYITGTALNTTMICGVFRSGGDSRFGFYCDLIDMWVYAVPLGLFAAFVLRLPVMWVYFLLMTDEFVKWPFVIRHYKKGQWLRNITRDNLFEAK